MSSLGLVILIGLLGGLAIGLQQPLSSLLGGRLGMIEGIFIVQMGGVLAAGLIVLARRGGGLVNWQSVPWYALICGVLSLAIIGAVAYVIPRQGAVTATFLLVTGQLTASVFIDHYGLFDVAVHRLDPSRLIGVGVLLLGVWLIVR